MGQEFFLTHWLCSVQGLGTEQGLSHALNSPGGWLWVSRWVTVPADGFPGDCTPGGVTSPSLAGGPVCPVTLLAAGTAPCLAGSHAHSLLPASIVTSSTLSRGAPGVLISALELLS